MHQYFHMDNKLFDSWTDQLIDKASTAAAIGVSNEYCNQISEPEYGLRLLNWSDQSFEIIDEHKYTIFLLRYR